MCWENGGGWIIPWGAAGVCCCFSGGPAWLLVRKTLGQDSKLQLLTKWSWVTQRLSRYNYFLQHIPFALLLTASGQGVCVAPASVCPEKDSLQKAIDSFGCECFPPTSDYRAKFQYWGTCVQTGRSVSIDTVGAMYSYAVSCTAVILLSSLLLRIPLAGSIVLINKVMLANSYSPV